MTHLQIRKNQTKFDLVINRSKSLGKLLTSIFGLLEYHVFEVFRYIDKILQVNSLEFVIKYIFKDKWGGRVIPLNLNIEPHVTFLPSQEILELISRSNVVGVATCYCRDIQRKHEIKNNCTYPINTCLHLGYGKSLYEVPFKSEDLKMVSKDRVKKLLTRFDKMGLVHQIIFFPNPYYYYVICNCCPCCCFVLSKFLKMGAPQLIKSDFIAKTNLEKCKGCGTCAMCYFGARKVINKRLKFNGNLCFGCGICVSKCPEKAILLQKR